MIIDGSLAVAAAGTRVPLSTISVRCSQVLVQAKYGNSKKIYLGGSTVSSTSGIELAPGQIQSLDPRSTENTPIDLAELFVDAEVNGEGIKYLAVARV